MAGKAGRINAPVPPGREGSSGGGSVSEGRDNYWIRRYSRRGVIRGAGVAGAALAGLGIACKASPSSTSGGSKPSTQAQPSEGAAPTSLQGHTQPQPKDEPAVTGGTLNWWIGANPASLDPQQNVSVNTLYLASGVLSRPFKFKGFWDIVQASNLETEPDLATSAESPDGQT